MKIPHQPLKFLIFSLLLIVALAACADEGDPAETVNAYLQARVESNADELRSLSCAAWESQAALQADSFRSMDARLEGVSCEKNGEDSDYTLVSCEGKIVTTYNGETREWEINTYHLIQEDDEWKICGEAETDTE